MEDQQNIHLLLDLIQNLFRPGISFELGIGESLKEPKLVNRVNVVIIIEAPLCSGASFWWKTIFSFAIQVYFHVFFVEKIY